MRNIINEEMINELYKVMINELNAVNEALAVTAV